MQFDPMQFEVHWMDVSSFLQSQQQPIFMLERPLLHGTAANGGVFNTSTIARTGKYYVPTSDLLRDEVEFSIVNSGEFVRIPIFAYRTASRSLSALAGTAMQLGLAARNSLALRTNAAVEAAVMILGHECHDLLQDGFRCYAGLAFRLKG